MTLIKDPVLFSTFFGITPDCLQSSGLLDPFVNVDTPLFVDPVLLEHSSNPIIRDQGLTRFRNHFSNFVRLLAISETVNDAPWRAAYRLLDLQEPPENGLGYGGNGRSGSSRPSDIRQAIMRTAREIITLGSRDPEMISLMGFFEEGVGPDTISDFTTRVITPSLACLTETFCITHGIPVQLTRVNPDFKLPVFADTSTRDKPLLLIPEDIVRELPVANDWSDIESAALRNNEIRNKINSFLAGIIRPTVLDRKMALRAVALSSADTFEHFLMAVKEHTSFYDRNLDALGYFRLKDIIARGFEGLDAPHNYDLVAGPQQIRQLALDTIEIFKHHVENGNLWEELWIGEKPKKERAAQLLYYAIADCFCKANNVDISPEANMGGGPIDFKFSKGYSARVLVEMKRSGGTVEHGYEKQLEIYKSAARTEYGIFVIMDYGDLGGKLERVEQIRQDRLGRGEMASDIIVIDARKKASASKRA